MNDSGSGRKALTKEQQDEIEKALPAARAIASLLSTVCPTIEPREVRAIAEAELAAEALRWNPERGTSLVQFALKAIVGAIFDAAKKKESPALRAARKAGFTHAEGLRQQKDLESRIAETDQERRRRARELGEELADAMFYAYMGKCPPPTALDEIIRQETFSKARMAREALDREDAAFLDLLYEEDLGWEVVAARLQISISTAQRREVKLLKRLRAALLAKGVREPPPSDE